MKLSRKAQMSLEYIAKLVIILVVVSVVIGMIYSFRKDIMKQWDTIASPNLDEDIDTNAAFIEGPFNADDFAHFIELCWVETRDAEDERVCFVLKGIVANPGTAQNDINAILLADYPEIAASVDYMDVNFADDLFSINYEIDGNKIHIKS